MDYTVKNDKGDMKKLILIWIIAFLIIPFAYSKGSSFPELICNGNYCRTYNMTFEALGNNWTGTVTTNSGNYYNNNPNSAGYLIHRLWNQTETNWSLMFKYKDVSVGSADNTLSFRDGNLSGGLGVSKYVHFRQTGGSGAGVYSLRVGSDLCSWSLGSNWNTLQFIYWTNSTISLKVNNINECNANLGVNGLTYLTATYYDGMVGQYQIDNMTAFNCSGTGSLCAYVNEPASTPTIVLNSQSPPDLTSINGIGINITIGATVSTPLGFSNSYLTYKLNSTLFNQLVSVNGSSIFGYKNETYFKSVGNNYSYILDDNEIYPATYNLDDDVSDDTPHDSYSLQTTASYIFTSILNMSKDLNYNFLEIMSNSTGIQRIYGCNSSYKFESDSQQDPSLNTNCLLLNTISAGKPYNHTHSNYSQHQFITLPKLNYTNPYYFGIRGNNGFVSRVNYYAVPWSVRTNISKLTLNSGLTFTTPDYTLDLHVHQFSGNTSLYYSACVNDTSGNVACTNELKDSYELADLPPTAVNVYEPSKAYYKGYMWINYTSSSSPSNYSIVYYNISLYNPDFTFNKSINQNNSLNLSFYYNTALADFGSYRVGVKAYDSAGQTAEGYSFNFTIDNIPPNISVLYPDLNSHIDGVLYPFKINGTATDNNNILNITHNSAYFGQNTKTNNSFEFLNISSIPSGNYSITLTAYDLALNSFSAIWNFTIDITAPSIVRNLPILTTSYNQTGLYINTSATDDYELFDYNLTCLDNSGLTAYTHYKNLINYSYYSSSGFFTWASYSALTKSVFNCTTTARDTHTKSGIEDIEIELTDTKAKMKFKKNKIDFELINPLVYKGTKIKLKKNFDRYIINLETNTQEKQRFSPEPKHILITSESPIIIMKDSKYRGHLIMTSGQWLDFEGVNSTIDIIRHSQNIIEVVDYSTLNEIEYKSIGSLNAASSSFNLTKEAILYPNITVISPANNSNFYLNESIRSRAYCFDIYGQNLTISFLDSSFNGIVNISNDTFSESILNLTVLFNSTGYPAGTYYIDYTCFNQNVSTYFRNEITLTERPPILETSGINMFECILLTTTGVLTAFFFFLLAFGIMIFAKFTKHGVIGFFGAMILLIASFYIFVCVAYISLVIMAISFLLMWYFLHESWNGNL